MKNARLALLLLAIAVVVAPEDCSAACGPSEVCADVSTSLTGQIGVDNITIEWSTDSEDSTVELYRLKRYDCGTPTTCTVDVATVDAVGVCDTNEEYSYVDAPPTPLSSWTYTVEVWRDNNTRACAIDVEPQ